LRTRLRYRRMFILSLLRVSAFLHSQDPKRSYTALFDCLSDEREKGHARSFSLTLPKVRCRCLIFEVRFEGAIGYAARAGNASTIKFVVVQNPRRDLCAVCRASHFARGRRRAALSGENVAGYCGSRRYKSEERIARPAWRRLSSFVAGVIRPRAV